MYLLHDCGNDFDIVVQNEDFFLGECLLCHCFRVFGKKYHFGQDSFGGLFEGLAVCEGHIRAGGVEAGIILPPEIVYS